MKNVQIPQELFMELLRYHLLDDDSCAEKVKKRFGAKNECYGGAGIIYKIQNCPDGGETGKSPAGISGQAWNTRGFPLVVLS